MTRIREEEDSQWAPSITSAQWHYAVVLFFCRFQ